MYLIRDIIYIVPNGIKRDDFINRDIMLDRMYLALVSKFSKLRSFIYYLLNIFKDRKCFKIDITRHGALESFNHSIGCRCRKYPSRGSLWPLDGYIITLFYLYGLESSANQQ